MQCEGIVPNESTYACILKACAAIGAIDKGKEVHDEMSRQGLLEHHIVLGSALVDMYAKCGALRQAQTVLEKLPSCNVVSSTALIAGYAQNGQGQQGETFANLLKIVSPDEAVNVPHIVWHHKPFSEGESGAIDFSSNLDSNLEHQVHELQSKVANLTQELVSIKYRNMQTRGRKDTARGSRERISLKEDFLLEVSLQGL